MVGKAYTMRELKSIVDYLVERKAYGELKGRKMWTEYANSDKTTRTWQSLKETFLKRILPDIHNPYYKLTMDQVRSFRQGVDVAEKEKNNRLEFQNTGENLKEIQNEILTTNKDNEVQTTRCDIDSTNVDANELASTSIDNELAIATGEGITAAKIPSRCRSSAETLILEYEDAEDVQRALESPQNTENENKTKSLKDKLTFEYTAPLTPLVQNLLDDFETESESSDKEPQLNIDENVPTIDITGSESDNIQVENEAQASDNINNEADSTLEINDLDDSAPSQTNWEKETDNEKQTAQITEKDTTCESDKPQDSNLPIPNSKDNETENKNTHDVNALTVNEGQNQQINNDDNECSLKTTAELVSKESVKRKDCNNTIADTGNSTQNTCNTTSSDTVLPNNQEALNASKKTTQKSINCDTSDDVEKPNRSRKRSASKDSRDSKKHKTTEVKLNKNSKVQTISDSITVIEDTPPEQNTTRSVPQENKELPNTPVIEISTDSSTAKNVDQFDAIKTAIAEKIGQTGTNIEKSNDSAKNVETQTVEDTDIINPCLVSVSLYEEQFNNTKYLSDSDVVMTPAPEEKQNVDKPKPVADKTEERKNEPSKEDNKNKATEITENKNTETAIKENKEAEKIKIVSVDSKPKNKEMVSDVEQVRLERERALSNVFGFAHGVGASTSRKRHLSRRRRSVHYHRRHVSKNNDSYSSEWTEETDSESYVSPPRGRRNRMTRKYLKPKSSRILQNSEDGSLFVVFGKQILPLVKDGKHIKNFLTYRPDSASDEEESYWRQKYIEERQRVEEVKKLLKEAEKSAQSKEIATPSTSRSSGTSFTSHKPVQNGNSNQIEEKKVQPSQSKDEKMVLKIASKNGLEYCLEGGWNQISNVMPQVVQMMQGDKALMTNGKSMPNSKARSAKYVQEMSSQESTLEPTTVVADPEVHEKVNQIETEIFKEIEAWEMQDTEDANVTKRAPRRTSSASSASKIPAKKTRASKTLSTDSKEETKPTRSKRVAKTKIDKTEEEEPNTDNNETKKEKTISKKSKIDTTTGKEQGDAKAKEPSPKLAEKQKNATDNEEPSKIITRLSKQRELSKPKANLEVSPQSGMSSARRRLRTPKKYDTDSSASEVQPRPVKSTGKETPTPPDLDDEETRFRLPRPNEMAKLNKKVGDKKYRSLPVLKPLPEMHSIDSTRNLDSSASPLKIILPKRKKGVSYTARNKFNSRHLTRRRSEPPVQTLLSDSSNSIYFIPKRSSTSSTSLDSEVYKTASSKATTKKTILESNLEPIEEVCKSKNPIVRHFRSISKDSKSSNDNSVILEIGSSSNISSLSPELSIVEKLSVSRDLLIDKNYHPTINEAQQNKSSHLMDYTDYIISNVDVTAPLMDQLCDVQESLDDKMKSVNCADKTDSKQLKDNTDNLTLSETLDQRLRDLLLESAKKITGENNNQELLMEVDQTPKANAKKVRTRNRKINVDLTMDVDQSKSKSTKKTTKRKSSTPRKQKSAKNSKDLQSPIIEEEHMESCSIAGRNSCPPVMTFIPVDENANNCSDAILPEKIKTKKKKDVIKVKLPKSISRQSESVQKKSVENTRAAASNCTDSGINDNETVSGVLLRDSQDTIDLIHNHSETCLQTHECIENKSLEFVEDSVSIISVSSSLSSKNNSLDHVDIENLLSEETCNDREKIAPEREQSAVEIVKTTNVTPISPILSFNSSLITEDLSNSPQRPSNWYLLEEDVTNAAITSNGFGSNLRQIFPIACAVPNLSTISETSKENEDSRKAMNFQQ